MVVKQLDLKENNDITSIAYKKDYETGSAFITHHPNEDAFYISLQAHDFGWEGVRKSEFPLAIEIEHELNNLSLQNIDPSIDDEHCSCPKYYPALFSK